MVASRVHSFVRVPRLSCFGQFHEELVVRTKPSFNPRLRIHEVGAILLEQLEQFSVFVDAFEYTAANARSDVIDCQ